MQGALDELRREIEDLGRDLRDVRERVQRLEEDRAGAAGVRREEDRAGAAGVRLEEDRAGATGVRRVHRDENRTGPGPPLAPRAAALSAGTVALVGRTLVVLGGAYLVRALADRGLVPPLAGALGALLYAALWWVQAARSASRGQRTSALFHGFTGLAIAYPLVLETTLVFELMGVPAAAGVLVGLLALGLGVAWRSRLVPLAWGVLLAHVTTCFVLMLATHAFLPAVLALLASAAALEAAALRDRWLPLRWPVALGSDLALCMLVSATLHRIGEAATPSMPPAPTPAVVGALLALPAVFLSGFGIRSLRQGKPASVFEMIQVPLSLLVGLGGGAWVRLAIGASPVPLGALTLLGAAGAYAAAFAVLGPRVGRGRSFHAWACVGVGLALAGTPLLLPDRPGLQTAAWSMLALAAVAAGSRLDLATPKVHGSLYALAAAGASGLLAAAADGVAGDLRTPPPLPVAVGVAWGVAALCGATLLARRSADAPWQATIAGAVLAALATFSGVGVVASALAPPLLGAVPSRGPAAIAAARSVLIAATAMSLAFAAQRWRLRELRWLVPVALAGGAVKLLFEDLRVGDPVALCVAFGAYGGALIAIPRLLRVEPRIAHTGAGIPGGGMPHPYPHERTGRRRREPAKWGDR